MRFRPAVLLVLAAFTLTACLATSGPPRAGSPPAPGTEGDEVDSVDPAGPVMDWTDLTSEIALGDGWTLRDCDGDAPFWCFHTDDGELHGILELGRYVDDERFVELADLDPHEALRTLGREQNAWLLDDRAEGCPGDVFEADDLLDLEVDGAPAVARSHTLRSPSGDVVERILSVYILDGRDLVVAVVNAPAPETCVSDPEFTELTPEQLSGLESEILGLLRRSPLPHVTN